VALVQLSPTKAGAYLDCPRKFYLSYVVRERHGRRWAHLSFGNAVHGALRSWFDLPLAQRTPEQAPLLVAASWNNEGFGDTEQAERWKQRAIDMVSAYLSELDPSFDPLSTERTLAFKTDSFIMQGRVDRLDGDGDGVAVVDYKTGRNVPTEDEVRGAAALAMYAVMVQHVLRRPCTSVALHHVPSGERVSWQHSEESLTTQVRRMDTLATDISRAQDTWDSFDEACEQSDALDAVFPATPSSLCGFCDYWDVCVQGQAHSVRRESWEGLERD
jgi:RecB family exonuclease